MKIGQQKRTKKKRTKSEELSFYIEGRMFIFTHCRKNQRFCTRKGGNKPTLKDRKRQRNEGRGKEGDDRQVKEKKKQKAGESRAMPLSRQEASLMGRKQFICAGKKGAERT